MLLKTLVRVSFCRGQQSVEKLMAGNNAEDKRLNTQSYRTHISPLPQRIRGYHGSGKSIMGRG